MPRLWNQTIEAHRREVHEAILDATAALVAERGLLGVTMSEIAERTGIGRATLYKYFPDVETILLAWHERKVTRHLEHLVEIRDRAADADERLRGVLEAYALMHRERGRRHHGPEITVFLHSDEHVTGAHERLQEMIQDLLAQAAQAGVVRSDVDRHELATYCLHALRGAASLPSEAAVRRLVTVTLAGLRPPNDG